MRYPFPTSTHFRNSGNLRLALIRAWDQLTTWLHARADILAASKTVRQSLPNGTPTAIASWDAGAACRFGSFDETTGIFAFTEAGTFIVDANVQYDPNAAGSRTLTLRVNGASTRIARGAATGSLDFQSVSLPARFAVVDTVSITATQDSGVALFMNVAFLDIARLSV